MTRETRSVARQVEHSYVHEPNASLAYSDVSPPVPNDVVISEDFGFFEAHAKDGIDAMRRKDHKKDVKGRMGVMSGKDMKNGRKAHLEMEQHAKDMHRTMGDIRKEAYSRSLEKRPKARARDHRGHHERRRTRDMIPIEGGFFVWWQVMVRHRRKNYAYFDARQTWVEMSLARLNLQRGPIGK